MAKQEPKVVKSANENWAVAIFTGTLYENSDNVTELLSNQNPLLTIQAPESAKVTTDVYQDTSYTYVVYQPAPAAKK